MQVTVEQLDAHRAGGKIAQTTSDKELQILRQFFGFCFDRRWVEENPAKTAAKNQAYRKSKHVDGGREDCCGLRRYRQFKLRAAQARSPRSCSALHCPQNLKRGDAGTRSRSKPPNIAAHQENGRCSCRYPTNCIGRWTRYRLPGAQPHLHDTSSGTAGCQSWYIWHTRKGSVID